MTKNYYREYVWFCKNHDIKIAHLSGTKADELIFNTFVEKIVEEHIELDSQIKDQLGGQI